jgi:signal peptidase
MLVFVGVSLNFLLIYQRVFSPFQVVRSNSMAPGINTDDAVLLKDVDIARIEVGEVIIFRDPEAKDQLVVHRVTAIEDTGYTRVFTTKGDNNPAPDPEKVGAGAVVGGVLARFPRFGLLLDYIGEPLGFLTCVALPVACAFLIAVALWLGDRWRGRRTSRAGNYSPSPTAA